MLLTCLLLLGCGSGQDDGFGPGRADRPRPALATTTTILTASRDGDISGNHPNRNRGALDSMEVARPVRSLVGFEQAAIAAAVGSGTLRQAMLRLTIGLNEDNWGPQGRTVGVHRMRREWTEAGVTWQCADDAAPTNHQQDCDTGATWDMTAPDPALWKGTPTDSRLVTNGLRGVMEFDVTADVAAYLAGAANDGWIVRKMDEEGRGRIAFLTRESSAGPELVLKVEGTVTDTSRPAIPNGSGLPRTSNNTVVNPDNLEAEYLRDHIGVGFDASVSGGQVRDVFERYNATIVGGLAEPAELSYYVVRVPDPETWVAFRTLLDRLAEEPGVRAVIPMQINDVPLVRGRYPVDTLVAVDRRAWFLGGSGTSAQRTINAFRGIRAPLAWGCETGQYGDTKAAIAIIDPFLDISAPTPDLTVVRRGGALLTDTLVPMLVPPTLSDREHGLAVAAVAAAQGDNGLGGLGVAWGAPLHLYALHEGNLAPKNLLAPYVRAINGVASSGVRILNLSSTFGDQRLPTLVAFLQRSIEFYLAQSPQRVVVVAAPEVVSGSGITSSLSAVAAGQAPRAKALDVAIARAAMGGFGGQIIFVTATEALSGARWGRADVWVGGSAVGAPGDGILTLNASGSLASWEGTSFAAPMVAGTAALLWAMAPDLTGAEVVQLILEGAAEDRTDPLTGMMSPRPDIGVPGVYQLDAYAALRRLARERRDTPICGFPVVTRAVPDPETGATLTSVVLSRPGQGDQEVFRGAVANVTVAQGGRRIGIDGFGTAREVEFRNGSWQATPVRAARYDAWRQFLERDTAFISTFADASTGPSVWVEGASGSRGPLSPCVGLGAFVPGSVWRCSLGAIASSGDWIHAVVEGANYDVTGCGPGRAGYGSYLAPLRGGAPRVLREAPYDPCAASVPGTFVLPHVDVLAWRTDGAVAWVGQSSGTYVATRPEPDSLNPYPQPEVTPAGAVTVYSQHSVVLGVPTLNARSVADLTAFALGWMVDDMTLVSYDAPVGLSPPCVRTVRAGLAPEHHVSTSPLPGCLGVALEPLPANVRMRGVRAAPHHPDPVVPLASRVGSPMDRWLKSVRARSVQRVVLAN